MSVYFVQRARTAVRSFVRSASDEERLHIDPLRVHVRKSNHPIDPLSLRVGVRDGTPTIPTLDILTAVIDNQELRSRGTFTRFLEVSEDLAHEEGKYILVHQVFNNRLASFLSRRGYRSIQSGLFRLMVRSFLHKPKQKKDDTYELRGTELRP